MSGDRIQWWSGATPWLAVGSMKAMSWEVVDVVVFAIKGDVRDVVDVGIEVSVE